MFYPSSLFASFYISYLHLVVKKTIQAGFQITQQRRPIAIDGEIRFHVFGPAVPRPYFKSSKIKQIQLEQDSGKSLHHENMEKYF